MPSTVRHFYEFGPFRLDADKHRLMRNGELVHLSPKAIDALLVLVRSPGQLLEREALMRAVWADSFIEDANLTVAISHLRKALGQDAGTAEYIETVPRAGYRFVADVKEIHEEPAPLIIEKRTLSRTVIEEEEIHPPASPAVPGAASIVRNTSLVRTKPGTQIRFAWAVVALAAAAVVVTAWWALKKPDTAAARVRVSSIAVLPFYVVGGKPDDKHQGLGFADTLITRLSNLRELKVRPTSAVLEFENQPQDSLAFGRKTGVDAVMEGTIYRTNDQVRVTARLLKVADGSTLWSGQFERLVRDELAIQNEISTQVVDALALSLSGSERAALTKRFTESADAYQLYIKGRYEWKKRSWVGITEAERLFRNAIAKDPNFALAYVGLADVMVMNKANTQLALNAIERALALDPNLAEAHATLGFIRIFHEWRWADAEQALRKSIELNPGYVTAHHWYAQLLTIQGRHEEAKAEMQRALQIDPRSYNILGDMGQIYYFNREYREAEAYCLKALEIYPDFQFAHNYLFSIYLKTGEHDKALEARLAAEKSHSFFAHQSAERQKQVEAALARDRTTYREAGIRKFMEDRIQGGPHDGDACSVFSAFYAFLGEKDKALTCLEKAYDERGFMLVFVKADPVFDNLRSEPRYQDTLRKMKLSD
ncbi:MAG TPA: tetratricopeptide repeat protein [Pyrinomonadaceae bacterium]